MNTVTVMTVSVEKIYKHIRVQSTNSSNFLNAGHGQLQDLQHLAELFDTAAGVPRM